MSMNFQPPISVHSTSFRVLELKQNCSCKMNFCNKNFQNWPLCTKRNYAVQKKWQWGFCPISKWELYCIGICSGPILWLVQFINFRFLPHLQFLMCKRNYTSFVVREQCTISVMGCCPICELPFQNGSYFNESLYSSFFFIVLLVD